MCGFSLRMPGLNLRIGGGHFRGPHGCHHHRPHGPHGCHHHRPHFGGPRSMMPPMAHCGCGGSMMPPSPMGGCCGGGIRGQLHQIKQMLMQMLGMTGGMGLGNNMSVNNGVVNNYFINA